MPRFNDNDPSSRLSKSADAKKALLNRFKTATVNDGAADERRAARLAVSQERDKRTAARAEAAKLEKERQLAAQEAKRLEDERLALEKAEEDARLRRAEADAEVQRLADQKAARDARYAARKARR